jgi:hypothetical protein
MCALHKRLYYTNADVNPELLTSWRGNDNSPELGAVSIMISGNRPSASHLLAKYPLYRLAILDGREEDLVKDYPLSLMPVISKVSSRLLVLNAILCSYQ